MSEQKVEDVGRKWTPRPKPMVASGAPAAVAVPELAGLEATANALRGGASIKRRQGAIRAAEQSEWLAGVYEAGALAIREALAKAIRREDEAPVEQKAVEVEKPTEPLPPIIEKGKQVRFLGPDDIKGKRS